MSDVRKVEVLIYRNDGPPMAAVIFRTEPDGGTVRYESNGLPFAIEYRPGGDAARILEALASAIMAAAEDVSKQFADVLGAGVRVEPDPRSLVAQLPRFDAAAAT